MDDRSDAGCCGGTRRLTTSELFDRGFRRKRLPPLATEGKSYSDVNGLSARFSLESGNGVLRDIRFTASTCVTLIAFCEFIAETMPGRHMIAAARLSADDLIAQLPDVHPLKRDRARLAVAAFQDALIAAWTRHRALEGFA